MKVTTMEKVALIKKQLRKPRTANEVIERIYDNDRKVGVDRPRKWLFYTHLNKVFAPMERMGVITLHGHKVGPSNRVEKIWRLK